MTSPLVRAAGARPYVYGHRGQRGLPENTLPAFERALDAGADGVELDVRVCKSGEVVIMHDTDLKRMAGRSEEVAALDYAELARIDLGGGARAPLLRELLQLTAARGARTNVEIKHDVPDLARVVRGVASELALLPSDQVAHIVVSSFSPDALVQLRALSPDTSLGFLFGDASAAANAPHLTGNHGQHPRHTLIDASSITELRRHATFINVWTVNDPLRARELAALGIDGIITDDPAAILSALRGKVDQTQDHLE